MKNETTFRKPKLRFSGLWKQTTRGGEEYLSGTVAKGLRLLVFKNDHRSENAPDYVAYMTNRGFDEDR